jgi:dTDP-4-amino-4,6-dideoxygalactose transaminase
MTAILAIAREHGLKVVEDAAHALPTTWRAAGGHAASSDATVFSFYANKTITTGEGGMLVTRDAAGRARAGDAPARHDRDAFDRFTAKVPSWYYEVVAPGFKYNLTDIAAALGLHQLKRAHAFQQRRAAIAAAYDAAFADLPLVLPPQPPPATGTPGTCTCCAWPTTPASGATASSSACMTPASAAACTTSRCTCTPTGATATAAAGMFPHSQHAYERMLSLPIYTRMSDDDVMRVAQAVRAALP